MGWLCAVYHFHGRIDVRTWMHRYGAYCIFLNFMCQGHRTHTWQVSMCKYTLTIVECHETSIL